MDDGERLARALDRELKALPDRAAPAALTERVMARVHEMDRVAWWRRSWFEWPVAVRVATAVVMFGWLTGLGAVDWTGSVALAREVSSLALAAVEFVIGLIASVPLLVWLLLGTVAAVSWFTLLGASVVCWQLVRVRR